MTDANDEMIAAYLDGFNLDNPEPSTNRSYSYQHGFSNGRADKLNKPRGLTFEQLNAAAEIAMKLDDEAAYPIPQAEGKRP